MNQNVFLVLCYVAVCFVLFVTQTKLQSERRRHKDTAQALAIAARSLSTYGFTYTEGAELWKPPIGEGLYAARYFDLGMKIESAVGRIGDEKADHHKEAIRIIWEETGVGYATYGDDAAHKVDCDPIMRL